MIADSPWNITIEAKPNDSAALTPRPAPIITIAVLMNSSGLVATLILLTIRGKKFPIIKTANQQ